MVENLENKISSPAKNSVASASTTLNHETMELNFVRNRLEAFQSNIMRDVQKRMAGMIDEVMQELRQHELQTHEFRNFAPPQRQLHKANTWNNRLHLPTTSAESPTSSADTKTSKMKVTEDSVDTTIVTATSADHRIPNPSIESKLNELDTSTKHIKRDKSRAFPEKVFQTRESYLTALLEVDHMKTIYHIFYIIFLIFLLNNITYDYFVNKSVSFGLGTFKSGFAKIHYVLGIWLIQKMFVSSIYYALKAWSKIRSRLNNQKTLQHAWSMSCLAMYITSQFIFAYLPPKLCLKLDLPYVTSCVLLLESIRMLMKMHAFTRTICSRVLQGKLKTEQDEDKKPVAVVFTAFQKYAYYLFAPTFLYRDEYPRTAVIRWKFALARFFEVVSVAFLYSYIHEHHIYPHFGNSGIEELSGASIIVKLFGMLMPCIIIYLCGFYLILHSWLNFTSELLRFGDRMFYRDWWTASNYEAYYRNWNVVVHDFLYEYIYKDCYAYVYRGSKLASSLTVFVISALFHEYVLGYALQVFFPVMFVFFGVFGVVLIFLTRKLPKNFGNLTIWFSLIYGNCLMICLYSMEYYARKNCQNESNGSWSDALVPHLWKCYMK